MSMPNASMSDHKILIPDGRPRLVQLDRHKKPLIIQSNRTEVVTVDRHWNQQTGHLETCHCNPKCPSWRVENFVSALEWVGPLTWEQRLWSISDTAMAQLNRLVQIKTSSKDLIGAGVNASRTGDRVNGRVVIEWLHHSPNVPRGFDVPYAVLKSTGVAADFFGGLPDGPDVPNVDQVVTPIRARTDKPHVPLGQPHRKK